MSHWMVLVLQIKINSCYHWPVKVLILDRAMTTFHSWSLIMLILDRAWITFRPLITTNAICWPSNDTLPLISYIADSGLLSDFIHTRQICWFNNLDTHCYFATTDCLFLMLLLFLIALNLFCTLEKESLLNIKWLWLNSEFFIQSEIFIAC